MEKEYKMFYYQHQQLYQFDHFQMNSSMQIDSDAAQNRSDIDLGSVVVFTFFMSEILYVGRVCNYDSDATDVFVLGCVNTTMGEACPRATIMRADRSYMATAHSTRQHPNNTQIGYTVSASCPTRGVEEMDTGEFLSFVQKRKLDAYIATLPRRETPVPVERASKKKHVSAETKARALQDLFGGMLQRDVAAKYGVDGHALRRWSEIWSTQSRVVSEHMGRKRALSEDDMRKITDALRDNPSASNRTLHETVGKKVSKQSISIYLRRAGIQRPKRPLTPANNNEVSPKMIDEMREYWHTVKAVPWSMRVYLDESAFTTGSGESDRWKLRLVLGLRGLLCSPFLSPEKETSSGEFVDYIRECVIPSLNPGQTVIWDRYGKTGRTDVPSEFHYDPSVRQWIEQKECRLLFLPPKERWFNPLCLLFYHIKASISKIILSSSPPTMDEPLLLQLINAVVKDIPSSHFVDFFEQKADGGNLRRYRPEIASQIFQ